MIHNFRNRLAAGLALVGLAGALLAPAVAGAQTIDPTPADKQYGNILSLSGGGENGGDPSGDPSGDSATGNVPGAVGSATGLQGNSATGLQGNVGPLPFTGFDVIAMIAVALGVTGLGLGLRRAVAREPSTPA